MQISQNFIATKTSRSDELSYIENKKPWFTFSDQFCVAVFMGVELSDNFLLVNKRWRVPRKSSYRKQQRNNKNRVLCQENAVFDNFFCFRTKKKV